VKTENHSKDPNAAQGKDLATVEQPIYQIADQAALHGLLVKLRNLCLPLISVNRVANPSGGGIQIAENE
jgi:hypothetical protein